jgi:ABC-type nitrate/sulfonate/bicarbonate transport system substrate-binding protein
MKWLICFVALAIPLNSQAAGKKQTEINFCYNQFREEMATAAVLAGESKGFFAANGIKVNLINDDQLKFDLDKVRKGSQIRAPSEGQPRSQPMLLEVGLIQKITKGECDVAVVGSEAMFYNKDNKGLQPLATYLYGTQYDTNFLTGKDSGVKTVADLKGKTVRIGRPSTAIILEKMLAEAGLTLNDVTVVKGSQDALVTKLAFNEFSGLIAYNPTIPLQLASGKTEILKKNLFATYLNPFIPSSVLVSSSQTLKEKNAAMSKFFTVFQKSAAYISENPEEIIYAMKSNLGPKVTYNFTKVEIEKAAALMKIGIPFYFDGKPQTQGGSKLTMEQVKEGFSHYMTEMYDHHLLRAMQDISYIKAM